MLSRSGRTDDSLLTCAPCSHRRPDLPVRKTDLAGRGALSTVRLKISMLATGSMSEFDRSLTAITLRPLNSQSSFLQRQVTVWTGRASHRSPALDLIHCRSRPPTGRADPEVSSPL